MLMRARVRVRRALDLIARHRALAAVLIAALALQLALAPFHGYFGDLQAYVQWGQIALRDPLHFYSAASAAATHQAGAYRPNYPPLTVALFGLLDAVYTAVAALLGHQAPLDVASNPLFAAYAKLPEIIASLVTSALIYAEARGVQRGARDNPREIRGAAAVAPVGPEELAPGQRRAVDRSLTAREFTPSGASSSYPLLLAALYAFAPAVIFDGALWGQTDALSTLGVALALRLAARGHGGWAGVCLGLATMIKVQPAIFVPLLLVYALRWQGVRGALRLAGGCAGAVAVCCLPLLVPPATELLVMLRIMRNVAATTPYASVDAYNLWWLLGLGRRNQSAPLWGSLSPLALGIALFTLLLLLALAGAWRDRAPARLYGAAALVALAFFGAMTMQRGRYVYPAIACFLLAAAWQRRQLVGYAVVSVTCFLNLLLGVVEYANLLKFGHPSAAQPQLAALRPWLHVHGGVTLAIAAINVALLLATALSLVRRLLPPHAPAGSSS